MERFLKFYFSLARAVGHFPHQIHWEAHCSRVQFIQQNSRLRSFLWHLNAIFHIFYLIYLFYSLACNYTGYLTHRKYVYLFLHSFWIILFTVACAGHVPSMFLGNQVSIHIKSTVNPPVFTVFTSRRSIFWL